MNASKIRVRYSHEFHELAKRTIEIIRVNSCNSCNSWRKIESKFKTVNFSKSERQQSYSDLILQKEYEITDMNFVNSRIYNEIFSKPNPVYPDL